MAGVTKCQRCSEMFDLKAQSVERLGRKDREFYNVDLVMVCPHCRAWNLPRHRGEQQTWDAIYEGVIA